MAQNHTDSIPIPIPITLPYLSPDGPTTFYLPRSQLQTAVRVLVVICTFFLFKPRLVALWRTMTGADIAENSEMRRRLEYWDKERQKASGEVTSTEGGKKRIAVVSGNDGIKVEQGRKPDLGSDNSTLRSGGSGATAGKKRKG